MSRLLKILLILCVTAASKAATPKNPDVERAVKSELVKRSFTTKILIGSYMPCPTLSRNDAIKAIDTELSPVGSIKYFARANCYFPGGFAQDFIRRYVSVGELSSGVQPGTLVWVQSVDFKDDRVEVNIYTNNAQSAAGSGKIKYMVGEGYRTWSTEQLMEVIAQGIQIPAYERLVQLKSELVRLRATLQESESNYSTPGKTVASKLEAAIALRQVLEQLQTNRAGFLAAGKSDPDSGVYSQKLNALLPEIAKLSDEDRKDRAAHARDQIQAQLQDLSKIQTQVRQKPPSNLAEWQQRSDLLVTYAGLLAIRQQLLDGLRSVGESPSPEDVKFMTDSKDEIDTAKSTLDRSRQQIVLFDVTSQFSQLSKKRAQLLDAYSRAFGTPKERTTLQELITVLGQMVANRDQAVGLGDKTAATQLLKCRAEAEKFKRK